MKRLLAALLAAAALAGFAATAARGSSWCGAATGSDLTPPVVPGPAVHLVYAYASDETDKLGTFATAMQTDAETIDAWWRTQDPTRTPRFDTAAFSCGPQVDITDVKLPNTAAELLPLDGRFELIGRGLRASGLVSSDFVDYLVYYDGPDAGDSICGQGLTPDPLHGGGVAVVYAGSCPDIPTAVTAAHEMTHALGAVEPPAPHACSGGHVCDSTSDLMYPTVDATPLSQLLLDVGRDDYYAAAGVGFDVRTSRWLRHLDMPPFHLAVGVTGSGTIFSDAPGIVCTAACASDWDGGVPVTLFATPGVGMRFIRWSGACTGETECTLAAPTGSVAVTALFAPAIFVITVGVAGRGAVSTSTGRRCSARCRVAVESYTGVTLRAAARSGWRFQRWTGACRGTRLICTVRMTKAASATALFVKRRAA